jgi:hypothetical protein
MRHAIALVLAAMSLNLLAGSARAQDRSGGWFGVGGGYGSASFSCAGCGSSDRQSSGGGYVEGGFALSPNVLVGMEFDAWHKNSDATETTLSLYNLSGTVKLYPSTASGFFLKGGLGASFIRVKSVSSNVTVSADLGKGPGAIFGLGYDIGGKLAITPAITFWFGKPGDLTIGGTTFASDWKQNVVALTVGLTIP